MAFAPLKALLVDDDPATLRRLAQWLGCAGYHVSSACDGKQAAALIEAECPHILITDWEMPQMNGLELVRWVRLQALPSYLYTIIHTARNSPLDRIQGFEAGADDFLCKPIAQDELLARLRAAARVLEMEHRLSLLAKTDAMTGLATQRTFYESLGREWSRAQRHRYPLSCVMLDIDFFKRINDSHGHPVGDGVIRAVARVLTDDCRASDIISRYGGEEFCILLPETDEAHAAEWANRIRQRIAELRIPVEGKEISVNVSLGVAECPSDTTAAQQLVDMSDQALLVAKLSGRDRVVRFRSLHESAALKSGSPDADPAAHLRGVPALSVMTTIVASLNHDDAVGTAAEYFLRFRISSAPVVDGAGKLVGMLSEKDLMAIMLWPNWWATKIKDVMKSNVVCYDEDTPALIIYEFLCRVTVGGAVIVNDGKPTGVITRSSLLRYFTNSLAISKTTGIRGEMSLAEEQALSAMIATAKPRQRVDQTAVALAHEAIDLRRRLEDRSSELIPCVVGGVSRIQELVNDLLACSRHADAADVNFSAGELTNAAEDADPDAAIAQQAASLLEAFRAAGLSDLTVVR